MSDGGASDVFPPLGASRALHLVCQPQTVPCRLDNSRREVPKRAASPTSHIKSSLPETRFSFLRQAVVDIYFTPFLYDTRDEQEAFRP